MPVQAPSAPLTSCVVPFAPRPRLTVTARASGARIRKRAWPWELTLRIPSAPAGSASRAGSPHGFQREQAGREHKKPVMSKAGDQRQNPTRHDSGSFFLGVASIVGPLAGKSDGRCGKDRCVEAAECCSRWCAGMMALALQGPQAFSAPCILSPRHRPTLHPSATYEPRTPITSTSRTARAWPSRGTCRAGGLRSSASPS